MPDTVLQDWQCRRGSTSCWLSLRVVGGNWDVSTGFSDLKTLDAVVESRAA